MTDAQTMFERASPSDDPFPPAAGRRKFMVVVDSTPECLKALRYAARRASHTNGAITMLYVIEPEEGNLWRSVGERMKREARARAEKRLQDLAGEVNDLVGIIPEFVIREGRPLDAVMGHLTEDPSIQILVLGAGTQSDGPGPLVSALITKLYEKLPRPLTVVPGSMTLEQIDEIS